MYLPGGRQARGSGRRWRGGPRERVSHAIGCHPKHGKRDWWRTCTGHGTVVYSVSHAIGCRTGTAAAMALPRALRHGRGGRQGRGRPVEQLPKQIPVPVCGLTVVAALRQHLLPRRELRRELLVRRALWKCAEHGKRGWWGTCTRHGTVVYSLQTCGGCRFTEVSII